MTRVQPLILTSVDWRRVGALSTSFSLHGIAIAVGLLAILAPITLPKPPPPPEALMTEWIEPLPIAPPEPPAAIQNDDHARTEPDLDRNPVTITTTDISPSLMADETEVALVPDSASTNPEAFTENVVDSVAPVNPVIARTDVAYAYAPNPDYPISARRKALEGETLLRVLIDVSGRAGRIEIVRSSGHRILDRAAVNAVRNWRFQPATENGIAVAGWVDIPVTFRIESH